LKICKWGVHLGSVRIEDGLASILNFGINSGNLIKSYPEEKNLSPPSAKILKPLTAAKTVPLKLLVQTSYAFLYGNNPATTEESFLQPPNYPAFASAVQAEKMVADSKIPLCLFRMGFLYGPQSRDLAAYKQSFNLFRPYYAGPQHNRANFLHYTDAASALALVAEKPTPTPAPQTLQADKAVSDSWEASIKLLNVVFVSFLQVVVFLWWIIPFLLVSLIWWWRKRSTLKRASPNVSSEIP